MRVMRGPFIFSTNQEVGLLIDGFDHDPVVLTTYNPPYYQGLVERYGLTKARDLYGYWLEAGPLPAGMVQAAERVQQRADVRIRTINLRNIQAEALLVRDIYNRAWSHNWGFVPVSEEEILEIARGLKLIVDPDLTLFAELDGKTVGFVICMPDVNRAIKPLNGRLLPFGWLKFLRAKRRLNFVRIFTLGVVPEHHPVGIGALLYQRVWEAGVRKGYVAGEMSWILEDNGPMNAAMQMMGGRIYKTWRIYDLPLQCRCAISRERGVGVHRRDPSGHWVTKVLKLRLPYGRRNSENGYGRVRAPSRSWDRRESRESLRAHSHRGRH